MKVVITFMAIHIPLNEFPPPPQRLPANYEVFVVLMGACIIYAKTIMWVVMACSQIDRQVLHVCLEWCQLCIQLQWKL